MWAYIYNAEGALSLQEVDIPQASAHSAVIKIEASSICGTDVRTYRFGSKKIAPPRIIGHEAVGSIVDKGDAVSGFAVGDRVQIAPAIGCGECPSCKKGHTNLCDNLKTIGFDYDGTFAEYMEIPADAFARDYVTSVPDSLLSVEAVLTEPIACIYNAQSYLNISEGDYVAIFGSGFIGTMHAQLAFIQGARKVFMIEVNDDRLEHAKSMLPSLIAINSLKQDLYQTILEQTDGQGVDVAVTACSVGVAQKQALDIIAKRGRVSLFGGLPTESTGFIDSNIIHYKEISVFGAHASTVAQNRHIMKLIEDKKLDVSPFIKRTYNLKDIETAFTALNSEKIVKAVIVP